MALILALLRCNGQTVLTFLRKVPISHFILSLLKYQPTVGENIIGTTKIRNNYVAIQLLIFLIFR